MGTPDYISPEQAQESHSVDGRADIYSLGCTLYFLLAGKVPFPGGSLAVKLLKHQQEEPSALHSHRTEVPDGLSLVVVRMMAKKPGDRYQTAAEVARALEPFLSAAVPTAIPLSGVRLAPSAVALKTTPPAGIPLPAATPVAQPVPANLARGLTASAPMAVPVPASADPSSETIPPSSGESASSWPSYIFKKLKLPEQPVRRRWVLTGIGSGLILLVLLFILLRSGKKPGPTKTGLDAFEADDIPATNRVKGQPKYLVAVFGGHRLRHAGQGILLLAISPARDHAATLGRDGTLRLFDPETLVEKWLLPQGADGITALAFSAKGKYLAMGTGAGLIRLYDPESGKELEPLREGHKGAINQVVFSPEGDILLSASEDTTVGVWDVRQRKLLRDFKEHTTPVHCVAISPDGRQALSGGGQADKKADCDPRLWEVATAEPVRTFASGGSPVRAVALPRRGPFALALDQENGLRCWDAEGKIVAGDRPADLSSGTLGLSPDGRHFVGLNSQKNLLTLWETARGRMVCPWRHTANGSGAFMPDSRRVLIPFEDTLRMWDTVDDREELVQKGHTQPVDFLTLRDNNQVLISGGRDALHVWDLEQKKDQRFEQGSGSRHAVSPSGRRALALVSGPPQPRLNLVDLKDGRILRSIQTPDLRGNFVRFLDDKTVMFDLKEGFVAVWDVEENHEVSRDPIAPGGAVDWMLPSPDGKHWLFRTNAGLTLWNRQEKMGAASWTSDISTAAFSTDGMKLYFGKPTSEVGVLDLPYDEKKPFHTYFLYHRSGIQNLALSPDGTRLVTSDATGHVVYWDTTKRGQNKIDDWDQLGGVSSLLFADDQHLFVGNGNTTIYLLRLRR
jgi:WD40 repeat protein